MSYPERASVSNTLLDKVHKVLSEHFQNDQFGVEDLAGHMHLSRSHLHRKLKRATGKSANQIIREFRLKRARDNIQFPLSHEH